jgi:hypothetical protein
MARNHSRIIQYPFAASMQGALLDSYEEEWRGEKLFVPLNIRLFERTSPSELFERDQIVYERVHGRYAPVQLRFSGVSDLKNRDFFINITKYPQDDPGRTIEDMLSWRQPGRQDTLYLFAMQAPQAESLMFFARHVNYEKVSQATSPDTLERDWCPPPPMPGRLIPQPKRLHQRFGGDPITFHIDSRAWHRRLFIGGLEAQGNERPQVDIVFNVGEKPSNWVKDNRTHPSDRWDNKGEGFDGMSTAVILEEAKWVADCLRKNQRVLVHCVAGMNRSSTICCAALILLEGLTAEQALERVREHHPWARPDSGHWLKLRWLARSHQESL